MIEFFSVVTGLFSSIDSTCQELDRNYQQIINMQVVMSSSWRSNLVLSLWNINDWFDGVAVPLHAINKPLNLKLVHIREFALFKVSLTTEWHQQIFKYSSAEKPAPLHNILFFSLAMEFHVHIQTQLCDDTNLSNFCSNNC